MAETLCGYPARDEVVVTYLYDDLDEATRSAFDAHLAICARCRADLAELREVRAHLAQWEPPLPRLPWQDSVATPEAPITRPRTGWRDIPAWAQVAAALLCVGVAAGLANLDIRYDRLGLSVHTGWSRSATSSRDARPGTGSAVPAGGPVSDIAPWRPDLIALERQLRTELRAGQVAAGALPLPRTSQATLSDAEIMRRVRALVEDSERRQQRELALRVGELVHNLDAQRTADFRRIDQKVGAVQNKTTFEVLRNREMLNYVAQKVSQTGGGRP
jgi:hypothetical protein